MRFSITDKLYVNIACFCGRGDAHINCDIFSILKFVNISNGYTRVVYSNFFFATKAIVAALEKQLYFVVLHANPPIGRVNGGILYGF